MSIPDELREVVYLGSFPITVEIAMCLFIATRVFFELLYNPKTFQGKISGTLLLLWVAAFFPVGIGMYFGYLDGLPNWSRGIRWLMISGSYFYGFILLKSISIADDRCLRVTFIPLTLAILCLISIHIFWSHLVFLNIALGVAVGCYFIADKNISKKLFGLGVLILFFNFIYTSSLAMYGIYFVALFYIVLVEFFGNYRSTKWLLVLSVFLAPILTALVLWLGFLQGDITQLLYAPLDANFYDRAYSKVLFDRYPFWSSAWSQIISSNFFIGHAGVPLLIDIPGLPSEWIMGSHNSILEILKVSGLFAGALILWIYFTALINLIAVILYHPSCFLRYFGAALLAIGEVGMFVGDFPVDMTVGFWIWTLASLCYGMYLKCLNNPRVAL
ncbi:hypothetical protein [Polynucleobacter sp. 73C-SIWE]|uniref:hypothetical protein n=1 Tax=Polynucleobacter sp. 73C-SIWE TaxID=2689098 RepID=UPI001C0BFD5A|nr:hypothetical protein [Polynucleobacter sp. 73C-SIWE]